MGTWRLERARDELEGGSPLLVGRGSRKAQNYREVSDIEPANRAVTP
jgi:hypothetical protein